MESQEEICNVNEGSHSKCVVPITNKNEMTNNAKQTNQSAWYDHVKML